MCGWLHRSLRRAGAPILALCIMAAVVSAKADEPVFGFVYTTDLLPQGQKEVEQWVTWKHQKAHGKYDQLENRTEFSYGVTDAFQLSGYLNYNWTRATRNGPDGTTRAPEQFADYGANPNARFEATRFSGAALEGIWRILSPYTDPFGFAVLLEPTIGPNFYEIEARLIFQKNFLDDRVITAFNLTWAPEFRHIPPNPFSDDRPTNPNVETDVNAGIGISYRFAPNWSFGWEFENEREINSWAIFSRRHWMGSAYYTGPTIHYGGEKFFATLTAWEQLPWAKNYMDSSVIVGGRDYDVDFEKFKTRLKIGYYF